MKINHLCVGCGQCTTFCKRGAIEVYGKANITSKCTKCGSCIPYCPLKSIEVIS
ncbi:4Fe-4S binding protein [Methanosalsum natronophilum]|uniref:Ferredoxin n=1 Tax=Methanosalsum natronophilum TaxID=768733 RepID=A0A424YNV6_9EURY|nr:4Fe-4S binding protein [Methanosalsum natronophilum]MCS3923204.1 NAD-dependent dihydropyrimidine dehydrogenase PreA subunit [Methanosalsum natronophilum]RQD80637.1 MAG: ferredoxin [Methanosalsum natronophilum]